ncbi:MAG TPA: hypothetical protein VHL58_10650 [Thermoanaerobaculia bacterium]|nr:hypothetical protein [Thermoanaerobaculia bacterium]
MTRLPILRRLALAICLLLVLVGCGRPEINRDRWLRMSSAEKRLTISSLRGREVAIVRKGGAVGPTHPLSDDVYVALVDRAYRAGDQRTVTAIWGHLRN